MQQPVAAEPSGRTRINPALLEALSTPLALTSLVPAPVRVAPPASAPAPTVRADVENEPTVVTLAESEPSPIAVDRSIRQGALAAPHRATAATPVRELLSRHFTTEVVSAPMTPIVGLGAPHWYWPFSGIAPGENGQDAAALAAVVAAALVAATALASAGSGLSGRPLRHTAWRQSPARRRGLTADWGTYQEAEQKALPPPEPMPIRWPWGRPKEAVVVAARRPPRPAVASPARRVA